MSDRTDIGEVLAEHGPQQTLTRMREAGLTVLGAVLTLKQVITWQELDQLVVECGHMWDNGEWEA